MKKVLSVVLAIVLMLSIMPTGLFSITASAATNEFAGGDGTESSPYLISTKTHLNNVRNYLNAHFKLTCNIEFTTSDFASYGSFYNSGKRWLPIGTTGSKYNYDYFTGSFDGNGFAIKNLYVNSSIGTAGLFGYNRGIIKNLHIIDCKIYTSYSGSSNSSASADAGGIAANNKGTITNCYVTGTISASASAIETYAYVGGIAGYNEGTITNCYNAGTISGTTSTSYYQYGGSHGNTYVGGIIGYNKNIVTDCYNIGNVSAAARKSSSKASVSASVGGIVGLNSGTTTNCFNTSNVTANSDGYADVGGIVGSNAKTINNCYFMDSMDKGVGSGTNTTTKCTAEQLGQKSTYVGFDFENIWDLNTTIEPYPIIKTLHYHIYDNVCDANCNECGYSREAPHSYIWVVDKENNCDTDGFKHEECEMCHIVRNENTKILATGHNYQWIVDQLETCSQNGIKHEECTVCNSTRNIGTLIAASPHTYTDNSDTSCDICNFKRFYISYDLNGGNAGPENIWIETASLQISKIVPTKNGYFLACWQTTGENSVEYQPGDTIAITDSTSLIAMWVENCSNCNGEGLEEYLEQCGKCYGKGTVLSNTTCSTCGGDGRYNPTIYVTCMSCNGTGDKLSACGFCGGYGGYFTYKCSSGHSMMSKYRLYSCSMCGSSSISETMHKCSTCGGYGTVDYCTTCGGDGEVTEQGDSKTCYSCSGAGYTRVDCSSCEAGNITKTRTCSACNGSCIQTPSAPTIYSVTANAVILNTIVNGEYSIDGAVWQDSPIFDNLESGKEYTFYQRYAKTNHTSQSKTSVGLSIITHRHIYDNACDTECNACGLTRATTHKYEWVVDKYETCGETGIKHEECTVCHATRSVSTEIEATGSHVYDTDCDTACNVCGYIRVAGDHVYDNACDATCNVCGFTQNGTGHSYDNDCDSICNACGQNRTVIHKYEWVIDKEENCGETGIKHEECVACHITRSIGTVIVATGNHAYDNVCDSTCNICGFRRDSIEHSYDNACDATCNMCGTIRTPSEHIYDDNDDHYCNVCNLYTLLRYQINRWSKTVTITGFDENYSGAFVIPETINGYPVTEIESYAFYNCSNLTSITIPNSISRIWGSAFSGCDNLSEVHISDISAWCNIKFSDLDANPISCGYFGDYHRKLFLNGSLVTDVVIPDGITEIGDYAFYGYSELKSVHIPDSVNSIGYAAFRQCTKLESVVIPDSVTSIGDYAFAYCENIKSLTLSKKVESIGSAAFCGCDLTEITIPESVTAIGSAAFYCENLDRINISSVKSWCKIQFNDISFSTLNLYIDGVLITDLVIPEGITTINKCAFAYCTNLKSVSFPNSLVAINGSSFYGCIGLESIIIPQNVSSFSVNAFKGCTSLASLSVASNNATYHSEGNCIIETDSKTLVFGLKTSTIPSDGSVTIIGDFAFDGCDGLKYVVIPNGVTTIKYYAFGRCKDLIAVDIPSSVMSIETAAFEKCTSLISVALPAGLTTLNQFVFNECNSLTNITIPKSITCIAYASLRYCPITNIYYSGDEDDKALMEIGGNNGSTPYATWHYNTCETHTYDNVCDAECNVCMYIRTVPTHNYDENYICTECGDVDYVPGDIDGVDGVTDADAEYLLMFTFFPEDYPVNQTCDFNGDGKINDADAEHLLMYTFFPEDYPLN